MRTTNPLPADVCKICSSRAEVQFGLPYAKKSSGEMPDEPDDCWYYQCENCGFLFTRATDEDQQDLVYDEDYWANQDPDWYGRVSETFRLVALANELVRRRLDEIEILDFGCGIGGFLEMGRKSLQLNVWGTDIIAPKVGKDFFLPDVGDRRFDVITSCEVIEHLTEPMETIAHIVSLLKRPGVFAFQTAQWVPSLGREWWYLGPNNGHISLYSEGALDYIFRTLGGVARRDWRGYKGVQAWLFA